MNFTFLTKYKYQQLDQIAYLCSFWTSSHVSSIFYIRHKSLMYQIWHSTTTTKNIIFLYINILCVRFSKWFNYCKRKKTKKFFIYIYTGSIYRVKIPKEKFQNKTSVFVGSSGQAGLWVFTNMHLCCPLLIFWNGQLLTSLQATRFSQINGKQIKSLPFITNILLYKMQTLS